MHTAKDQENQTSQHSGLPTTWGASRERRSVAVPAFLGLAALAFSAAGALGAAADTVGPRAVAAETSSDGSDIIVKFDEALQVTPAPDSGIRVEVDKAYASLVRTDYVVQGRTVTAALSTPVTAGQRVTVSLRRLAAATKPIRDIAGNAAQGTERPHLTAANNVPRVSLVLTPDSVVENGGSSNVTARVDVASSEETTVTVSVTANSPATSADVTLSTNRILRIAAGSLASTGSVQITANDNSEAAAPKRFTVSATVAAGEDGYAVAPASRTLFVDDDDSGGICARSQPVREAILARLDVSGCADVTDTHLSGIDNTLELRNRKISSLRAGDFAGLSSVGTLSLYGNALTSLPAGLLKGLSGLGVLYLDDNSLTALPADLLAPVPDLGEIWARENDLIGFPHGFFAGMSRLGEIQVYDNPGDPDLRELDPVSTHKGDPLGVYFSLEPLGQGRFKIVVPVGTPFDAAVSLSAINGTLVNERVVIPAGRLESDVQTVTRAPDTSAAVSVDIVDLRATRTDPRPGDYGRKLTNMLHNGIVPAKAGTLPAVVLPSLKPGVRVAASDSGESVTEGTAAAFTLTRDEPHDAALTVSVDVTQTGDVIKSTDAYEAPTSVEFPADEDTATLTVETQADALDEEDGTITVTVTAAESDTYAPGDPATAEVTVQDDDEKPSAVTALTATAGDAEVTLAWTAPSDTGTSAITGYQFRQAINEANPDYGDWQSITDSAEGETNASSYTVTGLTNATSYAFKVRAVSPAGEGLESNEATAAPAPADSDAVRTGAVSLGAQSPSRGRQFFEGYSLDRANGDEVDYFTFTTDDRYALGLGVRDQSVELEVTLEDADGATVGTAGPPADSSKDQVYIEWLAQVIVAGTYYVRVAALGDGATDYYIRFGLKDAPAPLAATGLTASDATRTTVDLAWTLPEQPAGVTVTGVEVQRETDGGWSTLATLASDATSHQATGLAEDTSHRFRIRLVTSTGDVDTEPVEASTTGPPSDADSTRAGAVSLGAQSPSRGRQFFEGYSLDRANDDAVDYFTFTTDDRYALGLGVRDQTVELEVTLEDDDGATVGTAGPPADPSKDQVYIEWLAQVIEAGTYYVRVAALGDGETDYYIRFGLKDAPAPTPLAATGLTASDPTRTTVDLAWTLPEQPAGVTVTGVEVQREAGGAWSTLATLAADATSHQATGLAEDTSHRFRIRLATSAGDADSDPVAASTTGPPPDPDSTRAGAVSLGTQSPTRGRQFFRGYSLDRADGDAVDYFTFTTEGHYELGLGVRDQSVELEVTLEDATGATVGTAGPPADPSKDQVYIEWLKQVIAPGTYYVRVAALADGTTDYYVRFGLTTVSAISVADARAEEGTDATADFEVTLDPAPRGAVTVTYATTDGTATAGVDYTAASGTLSFAAGETSKTVSVTILDDVRNEGEETFTLVLSAATGSAYLADAEATGVIANADPLPAAWLARFGRTAADHAVDAIDERLREPQQTGLRGRLGPLAFGGRLGCAEGGADRALGGDPDAETRCGSGGIGPASDIGAFGTATTDARPGAHGYDGQGMAAYGARIDLRDVLLGSSFRASLGAAEDGGRWLAAWGSTASTSFGGEADGVALSGDVASFTVGADAAWHRWLAGVAVSHSLGRGDYHAGERGDGKLFSALTTVLPYLRYDVNGRLSAWGTVGVGGGDLRLRTARAGVFDTRIALRTAAAGTRGVFLRGDRGLEFAGRVDARTAWIDSDAVDGPAGKMAASASSTSRMRLVLEGTRPFELGAGRMLMPTVELGVRRDGGDAETGDGVELGGALGYTDARRGLSIDVRARTLVAHGDAAYHEWGASASVRLDPGTTGRGLALSLAPEWGAAGMGGAERTWSVRTAADLAHGYGFDAGMRLAADVGYSMGAFRGRGVVTPFASTRTGAGMHELRTGVGWTLGPLQFGVEATRFESASMPAGHGVRLGATARW